MDENVEIIVCKKEGADLPFYASKGAAGADVKAYLSEERIVKPGETALIPTGLFFEIPEGYEIQVRPRSGLAVKHGVTILNSPGTIDSDYRGELLLILINHGALPFVITNGMRLAQIVVAPALQANFVVKEALSTSARGAGGFGSTGI